MRGRADRFGSAPECKLFASFIPEDPRYGGVPVGYFDGQPNAGRRDQTGHHVRFTGYISCFGWNGAASASGLKRCHDTDDTKRRSDDTRTILWAIKIGSENFQMSLIGGPTDIRYQNAGTRLCRPIYRERELKELLAWKPTTGLQPCDRRSC